MMGVNSLEVVMCMVSRSV